MVLHSTTSTTVPYVVYIVLLYVEDNYKYMGLYRSCRCLILRSDSVVHLDGGWRESGCACCLFEVQYIEHAI